MNIDLLISSPLARYLCLCLSETIFLDNFMKKIYNFINGVEMLNLYGTYEQGEEEEGEVYEVLNIRTLKQARDWLTGCEH